MIDIKATREAYSEEIFNDFMWIRPEYNIAHEMKRNAILPQLVALLKQEVSSMRSNNQLFTHWEH